MACFVDFSAEKSVFNRFIYNHIDFSAYDSFYFVDEVEEIVGVVEQIDLFLIEIYEEVHVALVVESGVRIEPKTHNLATLYFLHNAMIRSRFISMSLMRLVIISPIYLSLLSVPEYD